MKSKLLSALLMSIPGVAAADTEQLLTEPNEAEPQPLQAQRDCCSELVCVCHDMWFLLASVSDKKQADAAAPLFRNLITHTVALTDRMYKEGGQDVEVLTEAQEKLADSLDELAEEFDSLCRVRCFGSEKMIAEFRYAIEIGMFTDDYIACLDAPEPHLNEAETRSELVRFKRLIEPDKAVLAALCAVQDARSAGDAARELQALSALLDSLEPESKIKDRDFSPSAGKRARKAYEPIEPLLWGIRTEIVRIASLPGYHKTEFDPFSDALETVFRSLANTHYHFFDEVFDDSFHSDLDEALLENATTSK